jgi:tyrosine-protein kinase Etk/Wzc
MTPEGTVMTGAEQQAEVKDSDRAVNSILGFATLLKKNLRLLVFLPLAVSIVIYGFSYTFPDIYTASARFLPPQQNQSSPAAMLAQIAGAPSVNIGGAIGLKSLSDLYVGMLKSRKIADQIISGFDLLKKYDVKTMTDARKVLAADSFFASARDGIVTVEVEADNPKLAADMANAYVTELMKLSNGMAITEAAQRRLFFEKQVKAAKDALTKAQLAAREAMSEKGLTIVDGQGKAMIEASAMIRGQITLKEVQISSMQGYATDKNPEIIRLRQEVSSLTNQLAKLEGDVAVKTPDRMGNAAHADGFRSLSLLKEVKYSEMLFELMLKQYELARIDEAKEGAVIQVIDVAVVPDRRTGPKRSIAALVGYLIGFVAVLFYLIGREWIKRISKAENTKEAWEVFTGRSA